MSDELKKSPLFDSKSKRHRRVVTSHYETIVCVPRFHSSWLPPNALTLTPAWEGALGGAGSGKSSPGQLGIKSNCSN